MKEHSTPGKRHISWNGLALYIPRSWEVRAAGNQHLIFERSFQAVLEIRWQKTAKTSERFFTSARDQYSTLTGTKLTLKKTPAAVKEALTEFDMQCCGVDKVGIVLVLLLHRPSGTQIMVQLHAVDDRDKLWSTLASISCPDLEREEVTWKIQDFQVDIPPAYRLTRFTMEAGLSALYFENSSSQLQICRMAPADLRLHASSLEDIFSTLLGLPSREAMFYEDGGRLVYKRTPSILQQIGLRLRRQKPFIAAAFWHNQQANRLQGVFQHTIHPTSADVHSSICASYEIIPI